MHFMPQHLSNISPDYQVHPITDITKKSSPLAPIYSPGPLWLQKHSNPTYLSKVSLMKCIAMRFVIDPNRAQNALIKCKMTENNKQKEIFMKKPKQ